jgi:hypothetical protein
VDARSWEGELGSAVSSLSVPKTFNHCESEVYVLRALGETGGKADDEHEEKHCERNEHDSPLPG